MDLVSRADEDLLVDLLNTTPVVDGARTDELDDPKAARAWAKARGGTGEPREIAGLRKLRTTLQDAIAKEAPPSDIDRQLAGITLRPSLDSGALQWHLDVPADERLGARALLAWAATNDRAPGRLRPCANPECCRYLLDRSNANRAQWCSMALCGNRFKARRHYQRTRSGEN